MLGDDVSKYLLAAVECSVYLAPANFGLTFDELHEAARLAGFKRGETQDAIDILWRHRRLGDRRYLPEASAGGIGGGLDGDFNFSLDPDYRNPEAFEIVRVHLRELAREEGEKNARVPRPQLVHAAEKHGITGHDAEVAIAILVLCGIFQEKDGVISHAENRRRWPLPSEQLGKSRHGAIKRPAVGKAFPLVKELLLHRGLPPAAPSLSAPALDEGVRKDAVEEIDQLLAHRPAISGTAGVAEIATSFQACIRRMTPADSYYREQVEKLNPFPHVGEDVRTAQHFRALMQSFRNDVAAGKVALEGNTTMTKKVFVVHGRDDHAKLSVENFLHRLKLEPVVLHREPDGGRTIIEKLEQASAPVGYAIILLTPDDEGRLVGEAVMSARARQNVIFEWGLFVGTLKRKNVCALCKGVEIPSDLHGIIWKPMDVSGAWEAALERRSV